jgi:UDP-N-acetyl-D-glucosamine dehydrogenase
MLFAMPEQRAKVVVIGQGYVGLPLAMRAVEVGYDVVGLEVNEERVKRLSSADSYVEDITSGQLAAALATGQYLPTADATQLAGFDVALITVPTPLKEARPDLSFIEAAGNVLAKHLKPGATVVLESTTYPGTTEELLASLLHDGSDLVAGRDFHLGYSPERIDPGNPTFGLVGTPKVVSGVNASSLVAVQRFYDSIVDKTVPVSHPREAELTKLIENTFRHVNVALVNELAMFAAELGVDVWEALDAASTKPFGFMRFNPGPGVGGHCLPIDPSYLSWHVRTSLGRSFRFVELANDVNDHMPQYVVERLAAALNRRKLALNGSRVLLLGLAYKPNTSDMRESPALAVAQRLVRLGAGVRYVDDHIPELEPLPGGADAQLIRGTLSADEVAAADAVVVLTDHDDIDYEFVAEHSRYVLDTRHRCRGGVVEYL